jgi:hypothetical protein
LLPLSETIGPTPLRIETSSTTTLEKFWGNGQWGRSNSVVSTVHKVEICPTPGRWLAVER